MLCKALVMLTKNSLTHQYCTTTAINTLLCVWHPKHRHIFLWFYSFPFCFFFVFEKPKQKNPCIQYNIKKKEEQVEQQPQEEPNPLMRKKKTPEELAAEAEQEDLDDFTSKMRNRPIAVSFISNNKSNLIIYLRLCSYSMLVVFVCLFQNWKIR